MALDVLAGPDEKVAVMPLAEKGSDCNAVGSVGDFFGCH